MSKKENKQFFDGFLLGAILGGLILSTLIAAALFADGEEAGETMPPISLQSTLQNQLEQTGQAYDLALISRDKGRSVTIGEPRQTYEIRSSFTNHDGSVIFRLLSDNAPASANQSDCYPSQTNLFATVWAENGEQLSEIYQLGPSDSVTSWQTCVNIHGFADNSLYFTILSFGGIEQYQQLMIIDEKGELHEGPSYGISFASDTVQYPILHIWSYQDNSLVQIQRSEAEYSDLKGLGASRQQINLESVLEANAKLKTSEAVQVNLHAKHNRTAYEQGIEIQTADGQNIILSW